MEYLLSPNYSENEYGQNVFEMPKCRAPLAVVQDVICAYKLMHPYCNRQMSILVPSSWFQHWAPCTRFAKSCAPSAGRRNGFFNRLLNVSKYNKCWNIGFYHNMQFWDTEGLFAMCGSPQSAPSASKIPEMNRSRRVDITRYFYFFQTSNSRWDINVRKIQKNPFFLTKI